MFQLMALHDDFTVNILNIFKEIDITEILKRNGI